MRTSISNPTGVCSFMAFSLASQRKTLVLVGPFWRASRSFSAKGICRSRGISSHIPPQPCRTRFAPSPTGDLHLGSLRTALFNYLLAKATGGQFLLRIEDTDRKRTVKGAEERLFENLKWAGLEWDEGPEVGGPYGPYKQSERTVLYQEHAQKLLDSGHAYRCFCSPARLLELAKQRHELVLPEGYDRKCTHVTLEESATRAKNGETHVVRLKALATPPEWRDLVYGVRLAPKPSPARSVNPGFDDPILLKSDGSPTYHLANVIDDHYMKITHVIRGAEWMSSTPKHITLYQAFGWEPPAFAHVGLLVDDNHQKLSKRNLDTNIASYRAQGIFPETLTNFVALLGWSHNTKDDVKALQQLVQQFTMKFTKGDTMVAYEKLWFLQKAHAALRIISDDPVRKLTVAEPIMNLVGKEYGGASLDNILGGRKLEDYVTTLLGLSAGSYTNAAEYIEKYKYFFTAPKEEDLAAFQKQLASLEAVDPTIKLPAQEKEIIIAAFSHLESILPKNWTREKIANCEKDYISERADDALKRLDGVLGQGITEKTSLKTLKKAWALTVYGCIRWAICAGRPGPSSADALMLLGREESIRRLNLARDVVMRRPARGPAQVAAAL